MDWKQIANTVADLVSAAAPVLDVVAPGAASAVHIADRILQGVLASEPTALSLYSRIKSGEVPTPTELQQYANDYEASYQRLRADIAKKLAALPPA